MVRRFVPFIACCMLGAGGALADELRLNDGTVLEGDFIKEVDSVVVFRTLDGEQRYYATDHVSACQASVGKACQPFRSQANHRLIFLPTAFMPPQDAADIRSFEILYLDASYSLTSNTSISAGTLAGVVWNVGVKHQAWRNPEGNTAIAVGLGLGKFVIGGEGLDPLEWLVGGSVTFSRAFDPFDTHIPLGIHATVGYWGNGYREYRYRAGARTGWDYRWTGLPYGGIGFNAPIFTEAVSFLLEYSTPKNPVGRTFFLDLSSDNAESRIGFFNTGLRFQGDRSFFVDVAIMYTEAARPDEPAFRVAIPLLALGYRFR
jgi:hypothetical protein